MQPDQPRRVCCRYLRRSGEQCTGEATNPDGDVLLCTKHLARLLVELQHLGLLT